MSNTVKNFITLIISQGLRIPLSILSMALLGRLLGPDGMGRWAMVVATATLLYTVLLNWTQAPNVRFGCEEWEHKKTLSITWANRWPLLLIGFLIALFLLIFQPFGWLKHFSGNPSSWWIYVFFYFFGIWLMAESQNLLQIIGRMTYLAIVPVIAAGILVIFFGIISLTIHNPVKLEFVMSGIISLSLLFWGFIWVTEFRRIKCEWKWPVIKRVKEIFIYAWPLFPGFFVGYISDWGDQLILQTFFSSHEVGLFQASYQTMLACLGLSTPMTTIFLPKLIAKGSRDINAVNRYINKVVPTIVTIWTTAMVLLITILPFIFLLVMGAKYVEATPILLVLSIAVPGAVILNLYTVLFSLQGRLVQSVVINAIMTAVNVLVSLVLIHFVGPLGAAYGSGISYLVSQLLYIFDQHYFLKTSNKKILLLFSFMLVFNIIQILLGTLMLARLIWCIIFMVIFIYLSKYFNIVDYEVLNDIFSGRLMMFRALAHAILVKGGVAKA